MKPSTSPEWAVPLARYLATLSSGHVELTRGGETINLDPNSRIRIFDKGGAKAFTTVKNLGPAPAC